MTRGFFGIGIWHGKAEVNVGTLWRSAEAFGAAYVFTVGRRYRRQRSDTTQAWRRTPLFHFADLDALVDALPYSCPLVGVELDDRAHALPRFAHPDRAVYLLGAEDHGLTQEVRERCHQLILIPSRACLNVAVAGSIVMYDRAAKQTQAPARVLEEVMARR